MLNQNTKESWEEIYEKLTGWKLRGEFTQVILESGINDPAMIMGYVPGGYLYSSDIKSYTIPNSTIKIKEDAFWNCKLLKNVSIPISMVHIGSEAFFNCKSLTSIEIPINVKTIGDNAFFSCENLKDVIITAKNLIMGDGLFIDCINLKKIIFKGTIEEAFNL